MKVNATTDPLAAAVNPYDGVREINYAQGPQTRLKLRHSIWLLVFAVVLAILTFAVFFAGLWWRHLQHLRWILPLGVVGSASAIAGICISACLLADRRDRANSLVLLVANIVLTLINMAFALLGLGIWITFTRYPVKFSP